MNSWVMLIIAVAGALFLLAMNAEIVNDATDEELKPFQSRIVAVLFTPMIWTASWIMGMYQNERLKERLEPKQ